MTTNVTIRVNGAYRTTVQQTDSDGSTHPRVIIDGDSDDEAKKSYTFGLPHPATATFSVSEVPLTDAMIAERDAPPAEQAGDGEAAGKAAE